MLSPADRSAGKHSSRLSLSAGEGRPEAFVPYGVIQGVRLGPSAAVVAGAHGTEVGSQDGVLALWRRLNPDDVSGRLVVVFVANVAAAVSGTPEVNPLDGKNLNRVWPGDSQGSASERLAECIWGSLLKDCSPVLDVHGGEWTEDLHAFGILHRSGEADLDDRALRIASHARLPYLEITDAKGKWLGQGTLSAQTARDHRVGITLEIGGAGRRLAGEVELTTASIAAALAAAGVLQTPSGDAGTPTLVLEGSDAIRTPVGGVLVPAAEVGQAVVAGQELCRVTDFDGEPLESVRAVHAGRVLLRSVARVVNPGALVAKVGWLPQ